STFHIISFASYYKNRNPPPPSEVRWNKVSRDPISFHLSGDRYRYMDDLYSSPPLRVDRSIDRKEG
ncbi:hypothetical protein CEXT_5461, partial [Caerostris extrusa]